MAGKKKKPKKPDARTEALRGRKFFSKGSGENDMVRQAQRDYNGSYISGDLGGVEVGNPCLLYTSPSPRDRQKSRMPSSA